MSLSKREEFARGWRVLVAAALGSGAGVAPIAFYSLGAFITPLTHEFGWTRAQVTSASLVLSLGMLVSGSYVGAIADRYGARRVALFSQPILALSLAALALISANVWSLYLGYFALGAVAAGTLPITWSRVVTGWFVKARGFALGLSLLGTGVLGAFLPRYVTWLSSAFGWRHAYLGLAILPLSLGMPLALLFFREAPADIAAQSHVARRPLSSPENSTRSWGCSFREALSTWRFWQMSSAFFSLRRW